MEHIVIVGDSFCQHDQSDSWTRILADKLNMKLESKGTQSGSFWDARDFLKISVTDNTNIIVIAHTDFSRIPSAEWYGISRELFSNLSKPELSALNQAAANAKNQYYKHLYVPEFHKWAQKLWFKEFSDVYKKYKLINLHCFPSSWTNRHLLNGINIGPSLSAISLNEIGASDMSILGHDRGRLNHFNLKNNAVLADQLYNLISNFNEGDAYMDISAFDQKTTKWTDEWIL